MPKSKALLIFSCIAGALTLINWACLAASLLAWTSSDPRRGMLHQLRELADNGAFITALPLSLFLGKSPDSMLHAIVGFANAVFVAGMIAGLYLAIIYDRAQLRTDERTP